MGEGKRVREMPMAQAAAALTPAVPRPAHVPPALVHDFDMLADPGLSTDPHGRYRQLVAEAPPVFWTPRGGGHWMINRHDLAFEAARAWEAFSSEFPLPPTVEAMLAEAADGSRVPRTTPINLDPPAHARYRAPLNRAFSPAAVTRLQSDIRALAAELIDRVVDQGGCEAMRALAEPLPVQVFLKLMGLPLEHQAEYRALVRKQLSTPAGDVVTGAKQLQEMAAAMRGTILERRAAPRDDLISRLWAAELDGEMPTIELMEDYAVLLFIAGLDTVMNAIGFGLHHMAAHPALQARLRATPASIQVAVEELLRRYPLVQGTRRVARDLTFHGVAMREGDRLQLGLVSANLDPERFPDPLRVDLDREDKAHITFNAGPHRCVGSHLARLELQIFFEELLARLPPFRLDPEKPAAFHGGLVIGVDSLDLAWEA
jgi:cytochrome P450